MCMRMCVCMCMCMCIMADDVLKVFLLLTLDILIDADHVFKAS